MSAQLSFFDTQHVPCGRCGTPCRIAGPGNPDARVLRLAVKPSGYCANCGATDFLVNVLEINHLMDVNADIAGKRTKPQEALRLPHIREQFSAILRTGKADVQIEDLNWDVIEANWDLPFVKPKSSRKGKK